MAFLAVVVTFVVPVKADDVFWHLKAGASMLDTGRILDTNTFSFTAPQTPWIAHEWLAEVLFAWVFRQGPSLLRLVAVCLEVAAFAVLSVLASGRRRSPVASSVLTLFASFFLLANWSIRPYLLGNLLLLLTLWLIGAPPKRTRSVGLFFVFVVWANVHGSWLVGLGVVGLWALGATLRHDEQLGRRWAELAAALAASVMTPHHVRGLLFPFLYLRSSLRGAPGFLEEILEWQRVPLGSPLGVLLLSAVAVAATVIVSSRKKPGLEPTVLFLVFGLAAFSAVRNIALMGVGLVVLLPPHLAELSARLKGRVGRALAAAGEVDGHASSFLPISAWAVAAMTTVTAPFPRPPEFFPTGLLDALATHPTGPRLFHPFNWGGALMYSGHPVFIDQRNDCYPPEVWRDYLTVHHVRPGWEAVLEKWQIDTVAWTREGRLTAELRARPEWRLEHEDATAVLFSRERRGAVSHSPP